MFQGLLVILRLWSANDISLSNAQLDNKPHKHAAVIARFGEKKLLLEPPLFNLRDGSTEILNLHAWK